MNTDGLDPNNSVPTNLVVPARLPANVKNKMERLVSSLGEQREDNSYIDIDYIWIEAVKLAHSTLI